MKIAVVGTGYVGLVSGSCLAELGHTVTCADIDEKKIEILQNGGVPIYELGLQELIAKNVRRDALLFTTDVGAAIEGAEVVISAVGTPEDHETGEANMQYVYDVARTFAQHLNGYKILVNKSTVPVGTADEVTRIIREAADEKAEFDVVSNPEFLREGAAINDFLKPDRVVIGTNSPKAKQLMQRLYRPLKAHGFTVMYTDVRSAEVIKYASNAFLATKIAFINEVANFCEKVGANVVEVSKGMGLDSRIGSRFLYAGTGFGGSCFPKDVQALMQTAKKNGTSLAILEAVDESNDRQKLRPFDILNSVYGAELSGKKIAIWGLSFKPQTDDVREAPSLYITKALLEAGCTLRAYDPVAMESFQKTAGELQGITYATTAKDAISGTDALVILTEWEEFRSFDTDILVKELADKLVVDGRNIFERKKLESHGLKYFGIGT